MQPKQTIIQPRNMRNYGFRKKNDKHISDYTRGVINFKGDRDVPIKTLQGIFDHSPIYLC